MGIVLQAKHGKSAPRVRGRSSGGSALYKARMRKIHEQQDTISQALNRWPRGFDLADAPPHRNEWTPRPRPW